MANAAEQETADVAEETRIENIRSNDPAYKDISFSKFPQEDSSTPGEVVEWVPVAARYYKDRPIYKATAPDKNRDELEKRRRTPHFKRTLNVVDDLVQQIVTVRVNNGRVCQFRAAKSRREDWAPAWWTDAVCSLKVGEKAEFLRV